MPAKGYQYYKVDSFPNWELGNVFETTHQDSLLEDFDEAPRTVITATGLADYREFSKYHVKHETYKKVQGRYKNEPIAGYIAQEEFHIFYHSIIKSMIVDSTRINCKEMVTRVERSEKNFDVTSQDIDLVKLGNDLRVDVRGGWFGDLKVSDVSSIGIFGPTVGESQEWDRYEQVGTLKAIDLELDVEGRRILVKIMSNRGIVLFETITESKALVLLLKIQSTLDSYIISQQP